MAEQGDPTRPWLEHIKKVREAEGKSVDPTEASKGFLSKFKDRLLGDNEMLGIAVGRVALFGFLGRQTVIDVAQGNYPSATAEGVLAAISGVSLVRKGLKGAKEEFRRK